MTESESKTYDVFISYAHADAKTKAGKELIAQFKEQINTALEVVAGEDLVFLDSEALEWGEEWSKNIMECLQRCKIFVCLLSPNYQKSKYCKREWLMWERKEIRLGRLSKAASPVYYIRLTDKENEQLRIYQVDDAKPFFESLDEIKEGIVAEKIERVRKISTDIKKKKINEEKADSVSMGFVRISPFFVGRLGELAELCELCTHHLPIVTGGAGVGKTELVIAYASGYAELYPQGRFLMRMEGINDWNHAIVKLVEDNWYATDSIKDILSLPEDYEKLPIENKRKLVVQRLWKRSENGKLLLVLDNLEQLNLVSDSGLNRLYEGVGDIPDNVDIIATSRNSDLGRAEHIKALTHHYPTYDGLPILYEIDNLDTSSVFEMFCHISNNQFSFARCNPEYLKDDVRKEYDALLKIIDLLKGHVWALEIIAAYMSEKARENYTFQNKLEELKKSTTGISGESNLSYRNEALTPCMLLQPTFDYIESLDFGCEIGKKILELATVAAFFTPDMVSDVGLLGYWYKYYSDIQHNDFDTGIYALQQLHALHLLNGDGSISKMHRLTRDVLLDYQTDDKKVYIINQMQQYLKDYLSINRIPNKIQIHPWVLWGYEWINKIPILQMDNNYLMFVSCIAEEAKHNHLYTEAESLLSASLSFAQNKNDEKTVAFILNKIANFHSDLNISAEDTEREYANILSMRAKLNENITTVSYTDYANTLCDIAAFHVEINHSEEAEVEYKYALKIFQAASEVNHNLYDIKVANTLSDLASLHDQIGIKPPEEVEKEYKDALFIYRHLSEVNSNQYDYALAGILNRLASFHAKYNQFEEAECEYNEALYINNRLATISYDRYIPNVASTLNNIAYFHSILNRNHEAENEYYLALAIYRQLAELNHNRFDSLVAGILNNLASLHAENNRSKIAEEEYIEALSLYRNLSKNNRAPFELDIANTLINLALLHLGFKWSTYYTKLNQPINAEKEFLEALFIYQNLKNKILDILLQRLH